MLVGATIDPRDYETRIPMYPESRMCRIFGYSSKGLPAWAPETGDKRVDRIHQLNPGIVPALVYQDWPTDEAVHERVTALLDQVASPCRLTWRHEADRKREEPSQYRRRYFQLADWINGHRNAHLITLIPTSTYQWTVPNAPGKGGGDWSKYHVGVGTAGVDTYANSWESRYPDVAEFLAPLWRYRDAIGQNIEIPEFGAARLKIDTTGEQRATFIAAVADAMAAGGVTAVSYWDDLGSNGTDLRLSPTTAETPEVVAWRDVMHRHNTVE